MTIPPEITLHHCSSIHVASHTADNANAITLAIMGSTSLHEGEAKPIMEIVFFGLPEAATTKLLLAFGDAETNIQTIVNT